MKKQYNPEKHHRRSIRLKGYDYTQAGFYFITICIKQRKHLLGHIDQGKMILNPAGKMINKEWQKIPNRFPNTLLHAYAIMPNHFHAILEITDPVRATLVVAPMGDGDGQPQGIAPTKGIAPTRGIAPTDLPLDDNLSNDPAPTKKRLGDIIGAFESITTVAYIHGVKNDNWECFNGKLWQRNYWEHIIRDTDAYHRISRYILDNAKNWEKDRLNREK